MALADAILEIAEEMDAEAVQYPDDSSARADLVSFARQLRTAVKAAAPVSTPPYDLMTVPLDAAFRQRELEEAEIRRRTFEKVAEARIEQAESQGTRFAEVADGPLEYTMVTVHPNMPIGAFTAFNGHVYRMGDDGKLYHNPHAGQQG